MIRVVTSSSCSTYHLNSTDNLMDPGSGQGRLGGLQVKPFVPGRAFESFGPQLCERVLSRVESNNVDSSW